MSPPPSPLFVVVTLRHPPRGPNDVKSIYVPKAARRAYGVPEGKEWAIVLRETADVALVELPPHTENLYPRPHGWQLVEAARIMHGQPTAPRVHRIWRNRDVGRTTRSPFRRAISEAQALGASLATAPPLYLSPRLVDAAEAQLRDFLGELPHLRAAAEAVLRLAREDPPVSA